MMMMAGQTKMMAAMSRREAPAVAAEVQTSSKARGISCDGKEPQSIITPL